MPVLLSGARITIIITRASLAGGMILGEVTGVMRAYGATNRRRIIRMSCSRQWITTSVAIVKPLSSKLPRKAPISGPFDQLLQPEADCWVQ
jgi:ABC-type amino acid transport system permease subunit